MERQPIELSTLSKGAALIAEERDDHFITHNFDEDHDKANNNEELKYAAIFLLNPEKYKGVYPSWWSKEWKEKFIALSPKERLIKAGALLAAEYDRLEAEERINAGTGAETKTENKIPDGGLVQEMRDGLKAKKEETGPGPDPNLSELNSQPQ